MELSLFSRIFSLWNDTRRTSGARRELGIKKYCCANKNVGEGSNANLVVTLAFLGDHLANTPLWRGPTIGGGRGGNESTPFRGRCLQRRTLTRFRNSARESLLVYCLQIFMQMVAFLFFIGGHRSRGGRSTGVLPLGSMKHAPLQTVLSTNSFVCTVNDNFGLFTGLTLRRHLNF